MDQAVVASSSSLSTWCSRRPVARLTCSFHRVSVAEAIYDEKEHLSVSEGIHMVAAYFPGKVTTFESEQIMLALTCPLRTSE